MSESKMLINSNEMKEIVAGGHFVNSETAMVLPSVGELLAEEGPSEDVCKTEVGTSKLYTSSGLPKKRKRGVHKMKVIASGDDSESGLPEESGPSGRSENQRKKRKRRRKPRKYKPYNKLSWQERREKEDSETRRANRVRAQRFANGQPVAPYNTTQFLMEDHNDLQDIDVQPNQPQLQQQQQQQAPPIMQRHEQEHLERPNNAAPLFRQKPQRARDSSFSLDSEEDYFYSSPEDEQEFLRQEFSSAYEDLHAEQLTDLPKIKLVQDMISMEKKLDLMEKELKEVKSRSKRRGPSSDEDGEVKPGTSQEKVLLYKSEITKLSEENNRLRAENECLRRRCFGDEAHRVSTSSSSMDSESDSTGSTSGSCSSSSTEALQKVPPPSLQPKMEEAPEDNSKGAGNAACKETEEKSVSVESTPDPPPANPPQVADALKTGESANPVKVD